MRPRLGTFGRVVAGILVLLAVWAAPAPPAGTPPAPAPPPTSTPPTSSTSGPTPTTDPFTPVPDGVPAGETCRPDQPDATAALQRWLDGLPRDGARAALGPGRCYRVEGTLALHGLRDFVLDGRGATVRAFTAGPDDLAALRTRAHVSISGSEGLAVHDLAVDGGATSPGEDVPGQPTRTEAEAQHAFRVDGAALSGDDRTGPNRDVRLLDVQANRVRGDFVYVRATDGLDVVGARFGLGSPDGGDGAGRHGVAVVSGARVHVRDSEIWNASRAALDIEPNFDHEVIDDVRLEGSVIGRSGTGPTGLTFVANAGRDAAVTDVVIADNTLRGVPLWIVSSPPRPDTPYAATSPDDAVPPARESDFRRRRYVVRGNVSDTPVLRSGSLLGNRGIAMYFAGIEGLVVADNVVPMGDEAYPRLGMALVRVRDASDVRVEGNRAPAGDGDGDADLLGEYQGVDGLCAIANEVDGRPAPPVVPGRGSWWAQDTTTTC